MTFTQAQQFLLSMCNIPRQEYLKDAKHCGVYLKRLQYLLNLLGNPEKKIPHYVHVTGTSGKGSVSTFIANILTAAGHKTGITTSPHISAVTDRWHVDGKEMTKKEFIDIVEKLKPALDEYIRKTPYDMVSYHEITTAVGFLYFAQKKVEYAVVEVGAGGRYDSTNVIPHKDVAVITNIGMDHTAFIGPTKADIAYEKAGIIKKGCTVVTMERNKRILAIIEKETQKQEAKIKKIQDTRYKITSSDMEGTSFVYQKNLYRIRSLGTHQIKNAILGISVAQALAIPAQTIRQGLKKAKQPLRMEAISKNPLIILDSAHNPDKIKTTVATIQQHHLPSTVHLIVGFSNNKDIRRMVKYLAKLKPTSIAITRNTTNTFRKAAEPREIKVLFRQYCPRTRMEIFLDPHDAFIWSKIQAKKSDLILATGSLFVSGELR